MRDSDSKSVSANKAAMSITSTLYDRRALDCSEDKPLINSLNHLTFLTSSSLKVRDALANDGGLERLVAIMYAAKKPKNEMEKCSFAWKWVLAFQSLVLLGTRGSESVRRRLVDAGMIPLIATILDNYIISKKPSWATSSSGSSRSGTNSISQGTTRNINHTVPNTTINATANTSTAPTLHSRTARTSTTSTNNLPIGTHTAGLPPSVHRANQTIIDNNITEAQIESVFEEVTNLVDQADQTILEAELAIQLHENAGKGLNRKNLKRARQNAAKGINGEVVDEEYVKILKSLNYLRFLDKINSESDPSKINKDFLKNFDDLTKNEVFGSQMANALEISNLLTLNDEMPPSFFKKYDEKVNQSHPRQFENGVLIPEKDDVMWSLQILAFISKNGQ
ncbi:unnamed protein product [Ambrosiozyma monospora]|uniref:Unnamed protein product n=1 Tax=Ambrosiozyma monospora TaxID=43982 RepID=A0A9W6YQN5_AMBMO|nr:unnamed protein product [Ambrosiozyma monospora]